MAQRNNRGKDDRINDGAQGDTKDALLEELESIKGLLNDEDEIPVLREVIESIEPVNAEQPRQPSLFQTPPSERESPASRRAGGTPRASGENPFLPAHIRARLHGNRPPPNWDEPLRGDAIPNSATRDSAANEPSDPVSRTQLIDQLVSDIMPQLESRLRQQLEQATEEQLRHWAVTDGEEH